MKSFTFIAIKTHHQVLSFTLSWQKLQSKHNTQNFDLRQLLTSCMQAVQKKWARQGQRDGNSNS